MITSKLPNVGTTIFTTMSQLAAETGALNLSQGFPTSMARRPCSMQSAACQRPQPVFADDRPAGLRQQVAAKIARSYGATVDADSEVTITPAPPRRSSARSRR
jgi:methionine aminotransferase